MNELDTGDLRSLLNVMHYDAGRRYEILREELGHLVNSIRYRLDADRGSDGAFLAASNSHKAFLKRIEESALALHDECRAEAEAGTQLFERSRKDWVAATQLGRSGGGHLELACRAVLFNARFVNKALSLAERMGDLHDRLEQFLQRTNPDHPDPTLRRRFEQGLTDKYLSELGRWTHRDLAELVGKQYLGGRYVYDAIPSTFQFWAYSDTSRHHAFKTDAEHRQWIARVESPRHGRQELPPANGATSHRFVAVALSYWIPERPALVPVLGHELAHEVLRVVYGQEISMHLLEQDGSPLGTCCRRVHASAELWLAPHIAASETTTGMVKSLVNEILCDSLAAVRFGWAYAYAWILETMSDERLAQLFQDEYGAVRRLQPDRAEQPLADARLMARRLSGTLPMSYYRGRVLLQVLDSLGLESDPCATSIARAFRSLLAVVLHIYTDQNGRKDQNDRKDRKDQSGEQQRNFHRDLARDLADAVCFERKGTPNEFITTAKRFWSRTTGARKPGRRAFDNRSLHIQQLSQGYLEQFSRTMAQGGAAEGADLGRARMLTDLIWRTEWLLTDMATPSSSSATHSINGQRNRVRELLQLGMDDYLFRTGHPTRLFLPFLDAPSRARLRSKPIESNTLGAVARQYDDAPLRQLSGCLGAGPRPDDPSVDILGERYAIQGRLLAWLPSRIWQPDHFNRLAQRQAAAEEAFPDLKRSIIFLDLVRLRSDSALIDYSLKDQPILGKPPKYSVMASGSLLGRYDAFVFYVQNNNHGELGWTFARDGVAQQPPLPYVSRAKRLVRVWGDGDNLDLAPPGDKTSDLVALLLVSLTWDSSRTVMARWLATDPGLSQFKHLRVAVFLSDGWEDIVLAVAPHPDATPKQALAQCTVLLTLLNGSPFVASTETLFTSQVLEFPPDQFRFRFVCRVGPYGYEDAHVAFRDAFAVVARDLAPDPACCEAAGQLQAMDVAGNKDFELLLPDILRPHIRRVHRALQACLRKCRIETRVSWPRPIDDLTRPCAAGSQGTAQPPPLRAR